VYSLIVSKAYRETDIGNSQCLDKRSFDWIANSEIDKRTFNWIANSEIAKRLFNWIAKTEMYAP